MVLDKEYIKNYEMTFREDNTMTLNVSVFPLWPKQIRITTKDVMPFLESKGYKLNNCLFSSIITNEILEGKWIFEVIPPQNSAINIIELTDVKESDKIKEVINITEDQVSDLETNILKKKRKKKEV